MERGKHGPIHGEPRPTPRAVASRAGPLASAPVFNLPAERRTQYYLSCYRKEELKGKVPGMGEERAEGGNNNKKNG